MTPISIDILGYRGVSAQVLAKAVKKAFPSAEFQRTIDRLQNPTARFRVSGDEVAAFGQAVSALELVLWMEEFQLPHSLNDDSISVIQGNSAVITDTPMWDHNLMGTGQIVAVADTGLDRNESWFTTLNTGAGDNSAITSADFPVPPAVGSSFPTRKVFAYWVQPGASEYDDNSICTNSSNSYHGTHVVGSVLGDRGTASTPTAPNHDGDDGMAPNAQILFQDIGNDSTGCLSGLAGDLFNMFKQAFDGGARLHSDSWGNDSNGAYGGFDASVDFTLWTLERMLIMIAAGNSGSASGTIGSPANSKNAVAVGRVGHGNNTNVAGSSSRGPTDDGRIKPDLMAPGSSISSARGDDNDANVVDPGSTQLLSGTSMSTPTLTGGGFLWG